MPTTTTGKATELITFSRGSLATVTDSDGKIKWAPHNLLTNSEQFATSAWLAYTTTVTSNSAVAPNGTTTADTLAADGTNNWHYIKGTVAAGYARTAAVFVKSATHSVVQILFDSDSNVWANFDVVNGTVGSTGTNQTAAITPVGNGWFLCSVYTDSITAANFYISLVASSTAARASGGAYSTSVYLWGAHLYRSDLGGMQANASAYPMYNSSTPKNLLGFSEAFDNAAWTKSGLAATPVIANAIAAPNGSLSADLVIPSTSSSTHVIQQVPSVVNGTTYVASIYAKAGGYSKIGLRDNAAFNRWVTFDLTGAGSVISTGSSASGTITAVGDGWYRIQMTEAVGAATLSLTVYLMDSGYTSGDPLSYSYAGNGTSGIYLWGAQLSDSASLDAYSPTFAAVTAAAAYHGPRLDYDGSTLAAKGLLVEEARTNLVLRSQEFNTTWAATRATVSANVAVSPDGTSTADKIIDSVDANSHYIDQGVTIANATAYTFSIYAKADGRNWMTVWVPGLNTGANTYFNIGSGALGTVPSGITPTITSVGNGWYRCTVSGTSNATSSSIYIGTATANGTNTAAGDGSSGILIYGAQLEAGSFATSYIPTAASTVTRNADVASVGVSQFPYSASEGTLVAAFDYLGGSAANSSNQATVTLREASNSNIYLYNGGGKATAWCVVSGVDQAYLERSTVAANTTAKLAFAFKANDFAAVQDGGAVATDTTGTLPSPTTMAIGSSGSSSAYLNGHIRQITYIPRRLTNAELQARTA